MMLLIKRLIWIILLAICSKGIAEQSSDDFHYQVKVNPVNKNALHQFNINYEIYKSSLSPNLADIKVFDAADNLMPFMLSSQPESKDKLIRRKTKLYPLYKKKNLLSDTESIVLTYNQNNQLDSVTSSHPTEISQSIIGYILDLGEQTIASKRELVFDLTPVEQSRFLHVSIAKSNNLRNWSTLASNQVLAQLLHENNWSLHNRIKIPPTNSRYIRLAIKDKEPEFGITSVQQTYHLTTRQNKFRTKNVSFIKQANTDSYLLDVPVSIKLNRLTFSLSTAPYLLRGKLFYRNDQKREWRTFKTIDIYKISDGNSYIERNTIALNGLKTKQLKLDLEKSSNKQSKDLIAVELKWRPEKLIFIAAGQAPYTIVSGNSKAKTFDYDQYKIVEKVREEMSMPITDVEVLSEVYLEQSDKMLKDPFDYTQLALWTILVTAVLLMFWMARRLLKQIAE